MSISKKGLLIRHCGQNDMNKTGDMPQVREQAIAALTETVIELFDLFACLKQAYWKMDGSLFIKLDELAGHIMGHIDYAAERATALGGMTNDAFPEGISLPGFTPKRNLPAARNGFPDWIEVLALLYAKTSGHLRRAVKRLIEVHDFGSADLLADVIRTLDLHLWLLETHLSQQQLKTRTRPCFTPSLSS